VPLLPAVAGSVPVRRRQLEDRGDGVGNSRTAGPDDVGAGRAIAAAPAVSDRMAQNKTTSLVKRIRESAG